MTAGVIVPPVFVKIKTTAIQTPLSDGSNHTTILRQAKESIEIAQRLRGDIGDSYVRVNELVALGLAVIVGNTVQLANGAVPGAPIGIPIGGSGGSGVGAAGTTGPTGAAGPPGADGVDGEDSAVPGPAGKVGPAGLVGPPGADGVDGEDSSIPGPPGQPGSRGGAGPPGQDGADGEDGSPGPSGAAGPSGLAGPPGPPGDDGADGADGPPGATGASGIAGATGPAGPPGPPGQDGVDGEDSLIPGPTGASGVTGATGPAGSQGIAGFDGIDGEDSMVPGPTGQTGPAGPRGITGIDGIDGEDSMVPGPTGPAGATGNAGQAGAAGPVGPPGMDGEGGGSDDSIFIPIGFSPPTALLGLTAIPGASPLALRSDAAPALNQAITPTWTGLHIFSGTINGANLTQWQDGTNTLALFTQSAPNAVDFGTTTASELRLWANNASRVAIGTNGTVTFAAPTAAGHTIVSTAIAGSYAGSFAGSSTSGQSFGLFITGGTTSADAAIRVSNSGATANMFEIFGDGHGQLGPTAALGFTWTAAGNVTVAAPTSGRALLVNCANAQPAFEVSADAAFTDARSCVRFTALKTSSQQYDFGIDTQGSAAKNFEIRDITASGSPVRLRLSQGGFFTILDPAAVGTALTVNGSSAATSGAAFIANMGLVNQSFTLNGAASGRAFFDLQVNGVNKGYVGVNSAAGDLIAGSVLNALCLRSAAGLSVSVDGGSTAALVIGANNFTTHNGIVLSTKGNEGFNDTYIYSMAGGF